jgi:hypothetical protein
MNDKTPPKLEFLVLSRGQWDKDAKPEKIQQAIDEFYAWFERCLADGTMKMGQRLAREGKRVSKHAITDGPFAETREIVGGYWFIVAESLDEAAKLAARNPCLAYGLSYEIRPLELIRASAYATTNETPT